MAEKIYPFHEIPVGTIFICWDGEYMWLKKINETQGERPMTGEIKNFEKIDLVLVKEMKNV